MVHFSWAPVGSALSPRFQPVMKGSQHFLPDWLELLRLWSTETTIFCKISDFRGIFPYFLEKLNRQTIVRANEESCALFLLLDGPAKEHLCRQHLEYWFTYSSQTVYRPSPLPEACSPDRWENEQYDWQLTQQPEDCCAYIWLICFVF